MPTATFRYIANQQKLGPLHGHSFEIETDLQIHIARTATRLVPQCKTKSEHRDDPSTVPS